MAAACREGGVVFGTNHQTMTGTSFQHVPYRGLTFAMADLAAGQIDMVFPDPASALPLLRAGSGQVVFINSSSGLRARARSGQFAATQHAMKAVADSLREEVNADGIRVLSVFPGRTATPRTEQLFREERKVYRPELLMQPEDVAAMVVHSLKMPRTCEITEISMRPLFKSY